MAIRSWESGVMYVVFQDCLSKSQLEEAASRIKGSDRFEFADSSHVVIKGTERIVGYVGQGALELCCPQDTTSENYRVPHKHLKRLFGSVINHGPVAFAAHSSWPDQ